MDTQQIDRQYAELQSQAQNTVQLLQGLGGKLQAAAQGGDQQSREWLLDLRELALSFRAEQDRMTALLQSIHGMVANGAGGMPPQQGAGGWQGQAPAPQPGYGQGGYPQGNYPQQGGFAPQTAGAGAGGGMFGGFLNSGLGRALEMGAGFGIGDEIIKDIF